MWSRAAGFTVTAVLGDAEFGDNATRRDTLHRAQLPYALGVSSDLKVFLGTPALTMPAPQPGKDARGRVVCWGPTRTASKRASGPPHKPYASGDLSWRNGTAVPPRRRDDYLSTLSNMRGVQKNRGSGMPEPRGAVISSRRSR